jgi:uncharacterized protein YpmS
MSRLFTVFVLLLFAVVVTALAQEKPAPTLDNSTKELVTALLSTDQALAKTVQARVEAMMATKEGQAYNAALQERQKVQQAITAKVAEKVPGYVVDFATGKLVPKPATATK